MLLDQRVEPNDGFSGIAARRCRDGPGRGLGRPGRGAWSRTRGCTRCRARGGPRCRRRWWTGRWRRRRRRGGCRSDGRRGRRRRDGGRGSARGKLWGSDSVFLSALVSGQGRWLSRHHWARLREVRCDPRTRSEDRCRARRRPGHRAPAREARSARRDDDGAGRSHVASRRAGSDPRSGRGSRRDICFECARAVSRRHGCGPRHCRRRCCARWGRGESRAGG